MRLRRFSRSPLVFWSAVAVLASTTGFIASGYLDAARRQASRYGPLRPLLVAARDVDAGEVVRSGDLVVREVPAAMVPQRGLVDRRDAVGRTVVVKLFAGSPVLRGHLAPWGLHGIAALLPEGTRAVAVPTGSASVPVRRGDLVDVLATFEPQPADGASGGPAARGAAAEPTFPVAVAAPVVDVGREAVTVAVHPEDAKAVAFAVGRGAVTLTLTTPGSEREPGRGPPFPAPPGRPRTAGTTSTAPPGGPATPPALP